MQATTWFSGVLGVSALALIAAGALPACGGDDNGPTGQQIIGPDGVDNGDTGDTGATGSAGDATGERGDKTDDTGDATGDATAMDETGGDTTGDDAGGDETGGDTGGDPTGGDTGGDETGGDTTGDEPGGDTLTDEAFACLADACGDAFAACSELEACLEGLACALGCDGDEGCVEACVDAVEGAAAFVLGEVVPCGRDAGCFDAAPADDSCEGKCGVHVDGAVCNCDAACAALGDCCDDYTEVCDDGGPDEPVCGDGVCEVGETPQSCAGDCGGGGGGGGDDALLDCLAETCGAEVDACSADPECAEALACLSGCEVGDSGCAFECAQLGGFGGAAIGLALCVQASGCLDAGGGFCGDGTCDDTEDAQSCPLDCEGGGGGGGDDSELIQCIEEGCPAELAECVGDSGCLAVLECIGGCQADDTDCLFGCATVGGFSLPAISLGICAQGSGCFDFGGGGGGECGDGQCGDGEDLGSCPEDCGGGGDCGDGACQGGEGPNTCPEDCGGGGGGDSPLLDCLEAECGEAFAACEADAACAQVLECVADCDSADTDCLVGCSQAGGFSMPAIQLGICAQGSSCIEGGGGGGGPECGDGVCQPGETSGVCPEDCGQPGTVSEDLIECLDSECPEEFAACDFSPTCSSLVACIEDCDDWAPGSVTECYAACHEPLGPSQTTANLTECAQSVGCIALPGEPTGAVCGDGDCHPAETADSCPEDCDYPILPDCGDGICQPEEDASTCEADCGGGGGGGGDFVEELTECVEDACPDELEACYDSETCSGVLLCIDSCEDQGCVQDCLFGGGFSQSTIALGICAQQAGCADGFGGF